MYRIGYQGESGIIDRIKFFMKAHPIGFILIIILTFINIFIYPAKIIMNNFYSDVDGNTCDISANIDNDYTIPGVTYQSEFIDTS